MIRIQSAIAAIFAFAVSAQALAQITPMTTGAAKHPCKQIEQACAAAGFIKGEAKEGKGLWHDCIDPLIQGKTAADAKMPLPTVDPSVVAACKAKRPKFGEGKVGG